MNDNKAPVAMRNLILTSATETQLLKDDTFTSAEKVGDMGTALREASLGKKLGFQNFMCQNASSFTNGNTGTADSINSAGGHAAGSTDLVLNDETVATVGDYITVEGDMTPQLVTAVNATTSTVTVSPGLKSAVEDNAVVTVYNNAAIDNGSGYASGWGKTIHIDGLSAALTVGQLVKIGDYYYSVIDVDNYASGDQDIVLDRPLEAAVTDNAVVSLLPTGDYNLAFLRNAIALVTRPLSPPKAGAGALSAVANYDGLAIRVTITYDGNKQGHLVTVDLLCGVKVLDTDLGAVMLG